jgi:hypothetical protein
MQILILGKKMPEQSTFSTANVARATTAQHGYSLNFSWMFSALIDFCAYIAGNGEHPASRVIHGLS